MLGGRKLMRRHERGRAQAQGIQPRTLLDVDFLTGVDDETRLGALRFKDPGSEAFLTTTGRPVPPLIDLPSLLSASDRIDRGSPKRQRHSTCARTGNVSWWRAAQGHDLGDRNGQLLVAKFPKRDDDWPVTRWEVTALSLAQAAGILVPEWRLENIARKPVLMLGRFDRIGVDLRIPFMSAMTALDAVDHGERRSYLDLVDVLRQQGAAPDADLRQLWRRIVFNILISNTDDHLRNHAFLRDTRGWQTVARL